MIQQMRLLVSIYNLFFVVGSDWHGAVGTGLFKCRALIAVITNKYITSHYCTRYVSI